MSDGRDGSEKRREVRLPARIVTRMQKRGGEFVDLLTNSVSFKGAFIRTDAPPQLRQLVKLSFKTPQGLTVNVHAMVVYVVEPGDPQKIPGVGVQFWGPIDQPKTWERFVQELRVQAKEGTLTASEVDKVRRGSERFRMSLDVMIGDDLGQTRDLSLTGMAVRTDLAFEVGMRVFLTVSTKAGDKLDTYVIIRRQIREPNFTGVGVEFVDVTPEAMATLRKIVGKADATDGKIFAKPDDPELH